MNIDPLKNSEFVYSVNGLHRQVNGQRQAPKTSDENDQLSTGLSSKIREALTSVPEVRPEVVERGRQLLADPNYPSPEIVRKIAERITPFSES